MAEEKNHLIKWVYEEGYQQAAKDYMNMVLRPRRDEEKEPYTKEEIQYSINLMEKAILEMKAEYNIE